MSISKSIVISKVVSGLKQPDTIRTVTIRDTNGTTVATATETPANSGQYVATFTETNKWGYWYVDGVQKASYSNNSPFWLGLHHVVSGSSGQFNTITANNLPYTNTSNVWTATQQIAPLSGDADLRMYDGYSSESPWDIGMRVADGRFVIAKGNDLTTSPVVDLDYTTDRIGLRGTLYHSGSATITSTLAVSSSIASKNVNNIRYAHLASGSNASIKISASIADLPSTGGTVDGRGFEGSQTFTIDPFSGVTKSVQVLLGAATFTTDVQIVVPNKSQLIGMGRGDASSTNSVLKASATFPVNTSVVKLGGDSTAIFGTRIENLSIDCNSISGSSGVYTTRANEQCGVRHVLVSNYMAYGIQYGSSAISNGCQNCFIEDVELAASVSASVGIGIWMNGVASPRGVFGATINPNGGTTQPIGLKVDSTGGIYSGIHVEYHTDGILIGSKSAVDSATFEDISGHTSATVTNLIRISSNTSSQNLRFGTINKGASTNAIVDEIGGLTFTNTTGEYVLGNGAGSAKTKWHTDASQRKTFYGPLTNVGSFTNTGSFINVGDTTTTGSLLTLGNSITDGTVYTQRDNANGGFRFINYTGGVRAGLSSSIANTLSLLAGAGVDCLSIHGGTYNVIIGKGGASRLTDAEVRLVVIGDTNLSGSLTITGSLTYPKGAVNGYALVTNASGLASWSNAIPNVAYINTYNVFQVSQAIAPDAGDADLKMYDGYATSSPWDIGMRVADGKFVIARGLNLTSDPILTLDYTTGQMNITGKSVISGSLIASSSLVGRVSTVTPSSNTASFDAGNGNSVYISHNASLQVLSPTNGLDGQRVLYRIYNSSGGVITPFFVTGSNQFKFGTSFTSASAIAASTADYIDTVYNKPNNVWYVIGYSKGF